jgi:hypothetical protein
VPVLKSIAYWRQHLENFFGVQCTVCCLVKKLMLSLSMPRRHKRAVGVQTYSFLTSALGEMMANFTPDHLKTGKTH